MSEEKEPEVLPQGGEQDEDMEEPSSSRSQSDSQQSSQQERSADEGDSEGIYRSYNTINRIEGRARRSRGHGDPEWQQPSADPSRAAAQEARHCQEVCDCIETIAL